MSIEMMKYHGRIVDNPNPPPEEDLIAKLEMELGAVLPTDYRDFLLACNGGHVDYEIAVTFENGSQEFLSFCGMYPLRSPGQWETNPFELHQAQMLNAIPPKAVLPIACDGGGSGLYLELRSQCRVVAFVHGLPAWTGLRETDALIEVADSFQSYWQQLCISDDYVRDFIENYDPKYGNAELAAEWLDSGNAHWREKFHEAWNERVINRSSKETC